MCGLMVLEGTEGRTGWPPIVRRKPWDDCVWQARDGTGGETKAEATFNRPRFSSLPL